MDDSDDYIIDDIVFDDQALAVLDHEEQKYLNKSSNISSSAITSQPVNKRHKLENGWTPGIGASMDVGPDYEELPEISLQGDGSYGVGSHVKHMAASTSRFAPSRHNFGRIEHSGALPVNVNQQNLRGVAHAHHSPAVLSGARPFSINSRQKQASFNGNPSTTTLRSAEKAHGVPTNVPPSIELQSQMAELQKKLAELREENSKIQLALKEAADAKLSKEGEISILRKSIEKTAHSHATQLAQMKAEKEKADARQVQMQKETKDEMERLRTQFIFRQQELESTIRKPPASVRLKKINRELPSTPVAVPSVIRSWNANASQSVLPRTNVEETPLRPSRLLPVWKASPSSQSRKSPEKAKKQGMLPGFQNAFVTSTPMKSPTKRLNKGKGRLDYVSDTFGGQPSQDFHNLPQETIDLTQSMPDDATMSQGADKTAEPTPYNLLGPKSLPAKDDDMDADVVEENEEDPSLEIPDVIEEINWKAKLSYTILTHCHPTSRLITFQKLLGISQSGDSGMEYSMACASVLEVVANTATADDYEESLRILSRSLLSLLAILTDTEQLFDVAILLDLLSKLVLTLPKFRDMLLSSQIGSDTSILDITSMIILVRLQPTKPHAHRDDLAKDIISLLESFCFQASPESIKRLEAIPRNREVLMTLLHTSHPTWLLERVSRLLVLLSTQHALCRVLLDVPVTIGAQNQGFDEPTKNPLIERLCTHLIDTSRPDPEMFKIYILIFIAQLSIAHPDAHAVLVGSYVLIPSLILFVTHLTTPLWEDDGKLDASPETTSSFIRTLNQTITLLYHLIFQTDPALNLRVKLQHAPHRPFNSISHMFVVTFGRLSYCEPPGWINAEGRQELEILSELAREILEVVVDGPETDSLWVAFQTEPEGDSVTDEEEMEARLMGVDA